MSWHDADWLARDLCAWGIPARVVSRPLLPTWRYAVEVPGLCLLAWGPHHRAQGPLGPFEPDRPPW